MPKAIRYRAGGKYLRHTMFSTTNSDFLGAYHGVPTDDIYDPLLAAEEERLTIESHKQDFAVAFGIPAEQIECEVIAWDGNPDHLPAEDETDAFERIPEEQRPGYVKPEPAEPTKAEKLGVLLTESKIPDDLKAALGPLIEELLR